MERRRKNFDKLRESCFNECFNFRLAFCISFVTRRPNKTQLSADLVKIVTKFKTKKSWEEMIWCFMADAVTHIKPHKETKKEKLNECGFRKLLLLMSP